MASPDKFLIFQTKLIISKPEQNFLVETVGWSICISFFTLYFGSFSKLWSCFSIHSLYHIWLPFRVLFAIFKLGCEGPNSRILLWLFPWEIWIQLSRELDKRRILHLVNILCCLLFTRFSIFTSFFLGFCINWFC